MYCLQANTSKSGSVALPSGCDRSNAEEGPPRKMPRLIPSIPPPSPSHRSLGRTAESGSGDGGGGAGAVEDEEEVGVEEEEDDWAKFKCRLCNYRSGAH